MKIELETLIYAFFICFIIACAVTYDDIRENQFKRYCYDKHIEKGIDFEECMIFMDELYEKKGAIK